MKLIALYIGLSSLYITDRGSTNVIALYIGLSSQQYLLLLYRHSNISTS